MTTDRLESEMDRAHREDMRAHRLIGDAALALRLLLDDRHAVVCLGYHLNGDAHVVRDGLETEAARIVRRWD